MNNFLFAETVSVNNLFQISLEVYWIDVQLPLFKKANLIFSGNLPVYALKQTAQNAPYEAISYRCVAEPIREKISTPGVEYKAVA